MILAIDTSLGTAVAVIDNDGVVLATASSDNQLGHAEVIGTLLQSVLDAAATAPEATAFEHTAPELTYVAVGMGPGPFTGLRVGIAAARAFALGRGIPVIPVVSHDAVALEILLHDQINQIDTSRFAVVTDARRREFAFTVYDGIDDDGLPQQATEPALIPRDELDACLAELGAERRDASVIPAAMVALAASRAVTAGRVRTSSEPLYLRAPDATIPHAPKRVGV